MGVVTITQEHSSPVAPGRMFNALMVDARNVMPKVMPQAIKSVVTISGQGGPGSVEQINFTDASPYKYVQNRLDVLDVEKYICHYTVIEGDALGDKLEKIAYEVAFEASADGGCVAKMVSHYHMKEGIEINEEEIKEGKEKAMGMYKAIEAYLIENPHVYST